MSEPRDRDLTFNPKTRSDHADSSEGTSRCLRSLQDKALVEDRKRPFFHISGYLDKSASTSAIESSKDNPLVRKEALKLQPAQI